MWTCIEFAGAEQEMGNNELSSLFEPEEDASLLSPARTQLCSSLESSVDVYTTSEVDCWTTVSDSEDLSSLTGKESSISSSEQVPPFEEEKTNKT